MTWVHAPLAELTCKELTIANKYWNTTVSELTLKSPSTHVVPSKGINISAALTPDLKNRTKSDWLTRIQNMLCNPVFLRF